MAQHSQGWAERPVSLRLREDIQEVLRWGDCELNRAAQYLMKIVSQRREQARRVYYGAVFEIKKEIRAERGCHGKA